jgi:hypothetical protein
MATTVILKTIVEALESQDPDTQTYMNLCTGECVALSERDDFGDTPGADPEEILKLREDGECPGFIALPDAFEIHEWDLMHRFAESLGDASHAQPLIDALDGQGAFRRFLDQLRMLDLLETWYAFRRKALENIARDWLEASGIPYVERAEDS